MKKGLFLLGILLLPSIIYMLFSLGEHHVQKLRAYGEFVVTSDGDTIYNPVPELDLRLSNGESAKLSDFEGRAVILNFFKLPCEDGCKKKGATLANYLNELVEPEKWCIVNVCITSDASQNEISETAKAHQIGMNNWYFAAATDSAKTEAFLNYVFVQNQKAKSSNEIPNDFFVMLDQKQVLREFFDSKIYQDNKKMEDAIKLVLLEPHMSWKNK